MKCFTKSLWVLLVLYLLGPILYISNIPISLYNGFDLSENISGKSKYSGEVLEVGRSHILLEDAEVERLTAIEHFSKLDLNGNRLKIGSGGVSFSDNRDHSLSIENGGLDSDSQFINFDLRDGKHIDARNITVGSSFHKVGMCILGNRGGVRGVSTFYAHSGFLLTGDLVLDGSFFYLNMAGAHLLGDVLVSNSGRLAIGVGNALSHESNIELRGSSLAFYLREEVCENYARSLVVEGRSEIVCYNIHGSSTLFLDDLLIKEGSFLEIQGLEYDGFRLLVRKDSEHLYASLERIGSQGYPSYKVELREYDSNYWQIVPRLPEPATYGAIFGAVGLGLAVWRKRRRSGCNLLEDSRCFGEGL